MTKNERIGYCPNCGSKLQITYCRNGVMVMFCPHVPAQVVQTGIGQMKHMEVYCHERTRSETNASKTVTRSTAVYEHAKSAKYTAKLEGLRKAFDKLAKGHITLEDLREATSSTVSDSKLLEYANLCVMLELPIDDLPKLFNASMRLGHALGIDSEAAIRALAIGVGRQSRLVLDNIGVVFKAKDAYAWFKREYPDKEFDRLTAWKCYALKQIDSKAAMLGSAAKSKVRLERLHAKLTDGRAKIGKKVLQHV